MRSCLNVLGKLLSFIGRAVIIVPKLIVKGVIMIFYLLQIVTEFLAGAIFFGNTLIVALTVITIVSSLVNGVGFWGAVLPSVIIGVILMGVYNLGASIFSIVFEAISMAFGWCGLAFVALNQALEIVYGGFVRLAGKESYDAYIKKGNEQSDIVSEDGTEEVNDEYTTTEQFKKEMNCESMSNAQFENYLRLLDEEDARNNKVIEI